MLKRRDDARLGARLDRRDYVLVGDLVLVVERHAHHAHDRVGEHRQEPDERLEEHDERHHRTDAAHGHLFGAAHGDALRNEVREHHEENRDEQEREDRLADHAAENGHGVDADLHHRKEVTRILLEVENEPGAVVALFGHALEPHLAGACEGDFRHGEVRRAYDEKRDEDELREHDRGFPEMTYGDRRALPPAAYCTAARVPHRFAGGKNSHPPEARRPDQDPRRRFRRRCPS